MKTRIHFIRRFFMKQGARKTQRMRRIFVAFMLLTVMAIPPVLGAGAREPVEVKEIRIAINDSPWLPGFEKLADYYEELNPNVRLIFNVFPYAGLYEKLVTEIPAGSTEFDLILLDDTWVSLFYDRGYLTPLHEIESGFEPDPEIISYANVMRWNHEKRYTTEDGVLYTLPINGNFHLFYYRKDLYEEAGFSTPPRTWDDVKQAAAALYDPAKPLYGYVLRGQRGNPVVFNFLPVLRSFGGDVLVDPPNDYRVRINDAAAHRALANYLELLTWTPPGSGDIGQSDMISLLASGRALQGIVVAAGSAHMDNPDISAVPGKIHFSVTPRAADGQHAPLLGMWVMGIPNVISDERKATTFEFMKWATSYEAQMKYVEFGAIPVRSDVMFSELADQQQFRFLIGMGESYDLVTERPRMPEWFEMEDIMGLHLNRAIIGEETPRQALAAIERKIIDLLRAEGYDTGSVR